MKIRIAVYSKTKSFWGGSFQYAKAVTEALAMLDRSRFEIRVWHEEDEEWHSICAKHDYPEFIMDEYDIPPAMMPLAKKIIALAQKLPENDVAGKKKLLEQLRPFSSDGKLDEYNPHILVCPQMGEPRYHKGAKHIGVIHDLMHRYEKQFPEVSKPRETAAREKLFQSLIAYCDTLMVDSKVGMRHVLECYPKARPEQLKIIPFAAFPEVVQAVPQRPSFEIPEKFFFYPAQFWMHKNHAGLARAVAMLEHKLPDIAVIAAGNTEQNGYEPFMEIVEKEGLGKNFILPGYVSSGEINWLYRHARALVMPTYFGPTNIPPLEAMALGCPVAVSGIYGMPEQCGNAALYFNPANPSELADVLCRLWTDDALCEDLKTKGTQRDKLYNEKHFAKLVASTVENIAATLPDAQLVD